MRASICLIESGRRRRASCSRSNDEPPVAGHFVSHSASGRGEVLLQQLLLPRASLLALVVHDLLAEQLDQLVRQRGDQRHEDEVLARPPGRPAAMVPAMAATSRANLPPRRLFSSIGFFSSCS